MSESGVIISLGDLSLGSTSIVTDLTAHNVVWQRFVEMGSIAGTEVTALRSGPLGEVPATGGKLVLVGQPNVGKSQLFRALTGRHVVVANYPGTTVEVAQAAARFRPEVVVVDTPGVVTLPARSEGEQVAVRLLLEGGVRAVALVGDAKNLRRTMLLAVQVAELGLPMALALNMMDEAEERGVGVDHELLASHLGVPVVPTVATAGRGVDDLSRSLEEADAPAYHVTYPVEIEETVAAAVMAMTDTPVAARGLALLWLAGDPIAGAWLTDHLASAVYDELEAKRRHLQLGFQEPLSSVMQAARSAVVDRVVEAVLTDRRIGLLGWRARLGLLSAHPVWGLPLLAGVLYAMYWFVGVLGAGMLVDTLEDDLFGTAINPRVTDWVRDLLPVEVIVDLLVGDYGLWTMGMTYALALIMPIVATFFLAFGVLEDSGYLPRLAVLTNRAFRAMGLNGRAVVPMVLGLGCVTMATLTTRILDTKRERMLAIFLLALAVPCSAQLGVVMGLLAGISFTATLIWGTVVVGVLLAIGWLAAQLLAGERSMLLVELPPLRRPRLGNVVLKTLARVEWYLKEVIPIFLAGTAALFVLDRLEVLPRVISGAEPLVVGWLGLPAVAATAFLMGFLRRDFGAAGLFALATGGLLSPAQLVVALVTVTLFVPCIASVFVIARERSWLTAASVTAVIFPLAFLAGGALSRVLSIVGWGA